MQYRLRTLSRDNRVAHLVIDAASAREAQALAEQRQLAVLSVQAQAGWGLSRRAAFPLLEFCQQLRAMLDAGLSLLEAIEALTDKGGARPARAVLERLLADLRNGLSLSDAAARQPEVFPPLFLGLVRASEHTSDLPSALARYAEHALQLQQLRSRLVSAAIYPAILLAAGAAVSTFLMLYVVPSFAGVYRGSGRPMPLVSRWLMEWGEFAQAHSAGLGFVVLGLLAAAVAGAARLSRNGGWSRLLRRLPGLGERTRLVELARLYATLGMLLEGGLPMLAAMDLAASASSSAMREALAPAREAVSGGESLSRAFEAGGLTTPVALRMMAVGERSGQLGGMLLRCAAFHEAENTQWIERFSKIAEPALMTVIGLSVGAIVVLLYLPIFDLAGALQ